jgi:5'-nucleotidase
MDGVLVARSIGSPAPTDSSPGSASSGIASSSITNNSLYTRRDLAVRLRANGLDVAEEAIWTSALATAGLLAQQRPGGSAFVIGEAGLTTALYQAG